LRYSNPITFQEEIYQEEREKLYTNIKLLSAGEVLSDPLAEEISFLYYLNLQNDYHVPLLFPYRGFISVFSELRSKMMKTKMKEGQRRNHVDFLSSVSPRQKFNEILSEDEDIKNWFFKWIEDLMNFQKDTVNVMSQSIS
jgi:hypothetical protein